MKLGNKFKWLKYIIYFIDVLVLCLMFFLHLDLFGFEYKEILSGSMAPVLNVGDIVLISKSNMNEIQVGDIISYKLDENTIVHRVIEIDEEGLVTKGDAASEKDGIVVTEAEFGGKVIFHLTNGIHYIEIINSWYFRGIICVLILLNIIL